MAQAHGCSARAWAGGWPRPPALAAAPQPAAAPQRAARTHARLVAQQQGDTAPTFLPKPPPIDNQKSLSLSLSPVPLLANILPARTGRPGSSGSSSKPGPGGSCAPASACAPPPPVLAVAATPRVLQVQSAAELRHLIACHPRRLLVAHFGAVGCAFDAVLLRRLQAAAAAHPEALFLRLAVRPGEAEHEHEPLLQGLHIGALPCTLLLRGRELLARVQASEGGGGAAGAAPEAAADAAARQLQAAIEAAAALRRPVPAP